MILQKLIKNPVLFFGILALMFFLTDEKTQNLLREKFPRFKPNDCYYLIKRFQDYYKDTNSYRCDPDFTAHVFMNFEYKYTDISVLEKEAFKELANRIYLHSFHILPDTAMRIDKIRFHLIHKGLTITSLISGASLVNLSKITDKKEILNFLKENVTVNVTRKIE